MYKSLLIIILVTILILLITREFWCWFFKINEKIELLKSIESKLSLTLSAIEKQAQESRTRNQKEKISEKDSWYCEKCGSANSPKDNICKSCGGLKSKIMV